MNWRDQILISPAIHHGKPCIKGTRVPVSVIVGSIAEGNSVEQILASWPQLTKEDVVAVLRFASALSAEATVVPTLSDVE
jgi:uncharacterized protein (DUF433 family)